LLSIPALSQNGFANLIRCRWWSATGHYAIRCISGMLDGFPLHVRFDTVRTRAVLGILCIRPRNRSLREHPHGSATNEHCKHKNEQRIGERRYI
jgi:hypothetical protein